jgi:hypothetical protein
VQEWEKEQSLSKEWRLSESQDQAGSGMKAAKKKKQHLESETQEGKV